ncbi:hypothetical protein GIB67_034983 [Kingdonia uniflora]|uniref:Uncharacterized protein n=1 Tax=Kingdonia uniflora TaxID=39325 RepID=A0A7J7NHJ4_9MAGN|nr:hypothetical protein GIB67_034983 [Kingdonia uniflora]
MTIDRLEVDLSKAFGYGMVYVVLSQVKSLDELHLIGFNLLKIKAHPKVTEFNNSHFLNENFVRPQALQKKICPGTGNQAFHFLQIFSPGRPIIADFSPVTDFREATCRQFEENNCNRGVIALQHSLQGTPIARMEPGKV